MDVRDTRKIEPCSLVSHVHIRKLLRGHVLGKPHSLYLRDDRKVVAVGGFRERLSATEYLIITGLRFGT